MILRPLDNGPVAMKLDQPAAIDGPDQTGTAGTVERTMAAAAEQGRALQKRTTDRPRTGMPALVFGLPVDASSGGSALQRKFARSKGTLGAASSPCSGIGFPVCCGGAHTTAA